LELGNWRARSFALAFCFSEVPRGNFFNSGIHPTQITPLNFEGGASMSNPLQNKVLNKRTPRVLSIDFEPMKLIHKTKSLEALPPWHRAVIAASKENSEKVRLILMDAAKRTVWFGILLDGAKERGKRDKSIPHGQFNNWCAAFLDDLRQQTWRKQALTIGRHLIEKTKFKLSDAEHDKMIANPGYLPEPIQNVIDGKTRKILLLEAKECYERHDSEGVLEGRLGRLPGEGGRKRIPKSEQREILLRQADEHWFHPVNGLAAKLRVYGHKFCVLPDSDVEAIQSALDRQLAAVKTWLKTPHGQRDARNIENMLRRDWREQAKEQRPTSKQIEPKTTESMANIKLLAAQKKWELAEVEKISDPEKREKARALIESRYARPQTVKSSRPRHPLGQNRLAYLA
jgi:hypothetical protein